MAEATAHNAFHVIRGLQVKGGFLDGVRVAFDDNLNCVIGGRGTGKTTVMEVLRWALDQMPDQKTSPILRRNIEKLVQANLGNGVVEVEIQTDSGLRYLVRRAYGGVAMVMNSAGEPVEIDIGRGSIFSAEVYSQSQIEEIANDPLFQLKLIDKFITDEVKEIEGRIEICVRELGVNGGEILKVRGEVAALKEKVSVLPEITEKLKTYKIEEGDEQGQVLRNAGEEKALRDRERRAMGPKSFDDIWVEYDPARSALDHYGDPLWREHIQCKWHVTPDSYGYAHLVDPEFINANARSLLQRARDAQLAYAPNGGGIRFKLVTNWRVDRADPLRQMLGTRSGAVRLDRLYGSRTDNSKAGAVRKAWREHLSIDEEELKRLARTLAFGEATDTLDGLRDNLDILFRCVGMRRIPSNESVADACDGCHRTRS